MCLEIYWLFLQNRKRGKFNELIMHNHTVKKTFGQNIIYANVFCGTFASAYGDAMWQPGGV